MSQYYTLRTFNFYLLVMFYGIRAVGKIVFLRDHRSSSLQNANKLHDYSNLKQDAVNL